MKKLSFYKLFYIFIITSILGWFFEFIYTLLTKHMLINHSAVVIGPFDIAYGICGVVFTLLLYKLENASYLRVFITSFIGGSILEYIMSWGMELVLGVTAWDYSNFFLNINGRICLLYSIFWGLLGILWIKIIYPRFMKLIEKFDEQKAKKVMIVFIIFLIFDVLLTISAMDRAYDKEEGIPPQNSYEKFLDKTFNKKYLKNMLNNNWK